MNDLIIKITRYIGNGLGINQEFTDIECLNIYKEWLYFFIIIVSLVWLLYWLIIEELE